MGMGSVVNLALDLVDISDSGLDSGYVANSFLKFPCDWDLAGPENQYQ